MAYVRLGPGGVDHRRLGEHLTTCECCDRATGPIEVPLPQLVDALGQQEIAHRVDRVPEFRDDLVDITDRGLVRGRHPVREREVVVILLSVRLLLVPLLLLVPGAK